jgi:hypothetical protein
METEALIAKLAFGPRAPSRSAVTMHLSIGIAMSLIVAVSMLVFALPGGLSVAKIVARLTMPLFWTKVALLLSMTGAAAIIASRLSRPGVQVARASNMFIVPVVATWIVAAAVLVAASPGDRMSLLMGQTWRTCSAQIALLSMPALGILLAMVRKLAPTRPTLAGAVAGLLAGSISALTYTLRCPEMAVPFWAVWYMVGIFTPGLAGALIGRTALRW